VDPVEATGEVALGLSTLNPTERHLFGQPTLHEGSINRVVGNLGVHLSGVHVDRSRHPNAIYVADSGNNRVLGFDALGHCSTQLSRRCTLNADCAPGDKCVNEPQRVASLVFGQPALVDHGACNGNISDQGVPSRRSLCLIGTHLITPAESSIPIAMATDRNGDLYVPDPFNNRILKYNRPFDTHDTAAVAVIGQTSFGQNACNKGLAAPGPDTLCLQPFGLDHAGGAVDVDAAGNVWVADIVNSRVLRFAPGSNTANLVLGQAGFTTGVETCVTPRSPNVMCRPADVKVKPSTGEVYVVDQFPSGGIQVDNGQSRVLIFAPPFSNGMTASRVMSFPLSDTLAMARLRNLQFDPAGQGDVWISDLYKLVLFDSAGTPVTVIGKPDFAPPPAGDAFNDNFFNPDFAPHPAYDPKRTSGGIGVDQSGMLYVAGEFAVHDISNEVVRFPTPVPATTFVPTISGGKGTLLPNASLLTSGWNQITAKTMRDDFGMTAVNHQLFVGDHQRILVFNRFESAGVFPSAAFELGCSTGFGFCPNSFYASRDDARHLSHDAHNRVWVAAGRWIQIFQTPITSNNPAPMLTLKLAGPEGCDASDVGPCLDVHWADDLVGAPVHAAASSVTFDEANNALWVADGSDGFRRVLHIAAPLTAPRVDLVIGQATKDGSLCNLGTDPATAQTLCDASYVALDNFDNLYVVDSNYEGGGNRRVLEFDAADVVPVAGNLFPLPAAKRVYGQGGFNLSFANIPACDSGAAPCTPITVAFDPANRMIMSTDSYENDQFRRLWIFARPLTQQTPDFVVHVPLGQGGATTLVGADWLVQDHTWNRVTDFRYPLPLH
jgi:hypothetical protein